MTLTEVTLAEEPPALFAALADETRWRILVRIGREPASASTLAREMPVTRQAIAKHLQILADVGVATAKRAGRETVFAALGEPLTRTARHLEQIAAGWDRRLAQLKQGAENG